ncbi:unnamed protein product [Amoebophrya sp. A120]|nr:unnamed protein product [Amoebophrya sp. A120]|eukprot:GSA120T00011934001.1
MPESEHQRDQHVPSLAVSKKQHVQGYCHQSVSTTSRTHTSSSTPASSPSATLLWSWPSYYPARSSSPLLFAHAITQPEKRAQTDSDDLFYAPAADLPEPDSTGGSPPFEMQLPTTSDKLTPGTNATLPVSGYSMDQAGNVIADSPGILVPRPVSTAWASGTAAGNGTDAAGGHATTNATRNATGGANTPCYSMLRRRDGRCKVRTSKVLRLYNFLVVDAPASLWNLVEATVLTPLSWLAGTFAVEQASTTTESNIKKQEATAIPEQSASAVGPSQNESSPEAEIAIQLLQVGAASTSHTHTHAREDLKPNTDSSTADQLQRSKNSKNVAKEERTPEKEIDVKDGTATTKKHLGRQQAASTEDETVKHTADGSAHYPNVEEGAGRHGESGEEAVGDKPPSATKITPTSSATSTTPDTEEVDHDEVEDLSEKTGEETQQASEVQLKFDKKAVALDDKEKKSQKFPQGRLSSAPEPDDQGSTSQLTATAQQQEQQRPEKEAVDPDSLHQVHSSSVVADFGSNIPNSITVTAASSSTTTSAEVSGRAGGVIGDGKQKAGERDDRQGRDLVSPSSTAPYSALTSKLPVEDAPGGAALPISVTEAHATGAGTLQRLQESVPEPDQPQNGQRSFCYLLEELATEEGSKYVFGAPENRGRYFLARLLEIQELQKKKRVNVAEQVLGYLRTRNTIPPKVADNLARAIEKVLASYNKKIQEKKDDSTKEQDHKQRIAKAGAIGDSKRVAGQVGDSIASLKDAAPVGDTPDDDCLRVALEKLQGPLMFSKLLVAARGGLFGNAATVDRTRMYQERRFWKAWNAVTMQDTERESVRSFLSMFLKIPERNWSVRFENISSLEDPPMEAFQTLLNKMSDPNYNEEEIKPRNRLENILRFAWRLKQVPLTRALAKKVEEGVEALRQRLMQKTRNKEASSSTRQEEVSVSSSFLFSSSETSDKDTATGPARAPVPVSISSPGRSATGGSHGGRTMSMAMGDEDQDALERLPSTAAGAPAVSPIMSGTTTSKKVFTNKKAHTSSASASASDPHAPEHGQVQASSAAGTPPTTTYLHDLPNKVEPHAAATGTGSMVPVTSTTTNAVPRGRVLGGGTGLAANSRLLESTGPSEDGEGEDGAASTQHDPAPGTDVQPPATTGAASALAVGNDSPSADSATGAATDAITAAQEEHQLLRSKQPKIETNKKTDLHADSSSHSTGAKADGAIGGTSFSPASTLAATTAARIAIMDATTMGSTLESDQQAGLTSGNRKNHAPVVSQKRRTTEQDPDSRDVIGRRGSAKDYAASEPSAVDYVAASKSSTASPLSTTSASSSMADLSSADGAAVQMMGGVAATTTSTRVLDLSEKPPAASTTPTNSIPTADIVDGKTRVPAVRDLQLQSFSPTSREEAKPFDEGQSAAPLQKDDKGAQPAQHQELSQNTLQQASSTADPLLGVTKAESSGSVSSTTSGHGWGPNAALAETTTAAAGAVPAVRATSSTPSKTSDQRLLHDEHDSPSGPRPGKVPPRPTVREGEGTNEIGAGGSSSPSAAPSANHVGTATGARAEAEAEAATALELREMAQQLTPGKGDSGSAGEALTTSTAAKERTVGHKTPLTSGTDNLHPLNHDISSMSVSDGQETESELDAGGPLEGKPGPMQEAQPGAESSTMAPRS